MSKSAIIWIVVVIVVIVVVALGWWYFSQPSGVTTTTTTTTTTQSSEKSITSFAFLELNPQVNGVIDNINRNVNLTVPSGTNVTSLTPTISVSDNATISPISGVVQDFTNSVGYTVTAQDGTAQNYAVTVTVEAAQ